VQQLRRRFRTTPPRRVPRHLFVDARIEAAYQDSPRRLAQGQAISQPHIVAIMPDSLEILPALADSAWKRLQAPGYTSRGQ